MSQIEVPKPLAVGVATVVCLVLIGAIWLRSGGSDAARQEPRERVSIEQKQAQEKADFEQRKTEESHGRD